MLSNSPEGVHSHVHCMLAGAVAGRAESTSQTASGEIRAAVSPRWQDPSGIIIAAAFASEQGAGGAAAPPAGPPVRVEREGSTPRVAAPTRSPKVGVSGGGQESPGSKGSPGSMGAGVFRSLLRGASNGGGGQRMSRSDSGAAPTCLICLEPLTSEDFLVSVAGHETLRRDYPLSCLELGKIWLGIDRRREQGAEVLSRLSLLVRLLCS
jgi:hypothetical protein